MANQAHLDILKQGVHIWNEWRKKNQDLRVDLREAQLDNMNLAHVNFSGVMLARAQLKGTRLVHSNLRGAKLTASDMTGADLSGADMYRAVLYKAILAQTRLIKANFTRSNLSKADLTQSVLSRSDFRGADLSGARIRQAVLYETVFGDTDLSEAQDLETCRHHGPSTVDHRTVMRSVDIPLPFLRGCGIPDELIDYYRTMLERNVRVHTCLISYSKNDKSFAIQLHNDLQNYGIRCWLVPEELKGGQDLQLQISQAIGRNDKLVLILSDQSMASDWIGQELKATRDLEKQERRRLLFPVSLVHPGIVQSWTLMEPGTFVNLAKEIRQHPIPNFSDRHHEPSYQAALNQLLRDLKGGISHAHPYRPDADSTGELVV